MNDKLADFGNSSTDNSENQRTHLEYFNPRHPKNSGDEPEDYYDAAQASKNWGGSDFSRLTLVGEFLVGVQHWVEDDDPEDLLQVVGTILESEVELVDE